jgi:putative transcriptional regulator
MTAETLAAVFEAGRGNRAVELLAQTTFAMRADAGFVEREDDLAAAVFLAEEEPATLAAGALDRVFDRIEAAETLDRRALALADARDGLTAEIASLPSPVREAALQAMDEQHRWTFAGLGIQRLSLFTDRGEHAELLRIEPGHGVADHDHEGEELTLVLTGAYHDGHAAYLPGDASVARPGFVHTPKAEPGEVCYVLLAYRGALKFKGVFGLAQRAFGFPTPLKRPLPEGEGGARGRRPAGR